jgi:hypothetical protein
MAILERNRSFLYRVRQRVPDRRIVSPPILDTPAFVAVSTNVPS